MDIRTPYLNKIRPLLNCSSGINNVIETPELCVQLLLDSSTDFSTWDLSDHLYERVELYIRELICRLQRLKLLNDSEHTREQSIRYCTYLKTTY